LGLKLFTCGGGHVLLPDRNLVLVDRRDGGVLIVTPPREVWERGELSPEELTLWSFLVAATGRAMLDALPQLDGGCVNYWEAGNWALHERAEPAGPKRAREHRRVHANLLGRSRTAADPSWRWGEAPKFPDFDERHAWASEFERLSDGECRDVIARAEDLLKTRYGMRAAQVAPWSPCRACGYPSPLDQGWAVGACAECGAVA
jgi:hypothetical protein